MKRAAYLTSRTAAAVALCALALLACLCAGACSSGADDAADEETDPVLDIADTSGGVAAVVGDVEIGENAVTAYIENVRETQGLQDDADWASYLLYYDYEPSDVRDSILDGYVDQELLLMAAAEYDVEPTDDEVAAEVAVSEESVGSEEEWEETLAENGLTQQSYELSVRLLLIQDALVPLVCPDSAATDDMVLYYVQYYEDDYADAETLDDVPDDIVEEYREEADEDQQTSDLYAWLDEYGEEIGVTLYDMPSGLSYDIDLSEYEEDDDE